MERFGLVLLLLLNLRSVALNGTNTTDYDTAETIPSACDDGYDHFMNYYNSYYYTLYVSDWNDERWYNATQEGGYNLIASKDDIPYKCTNLYSGQVVVLREAHPDLSLINETMVPLSACLYNTTEEICVADVIIYVQKCNSELFYFLTHDEASSSYSTVYCTELYLPDPCQQTLKHFEVIAEDGGYLWVNIPYYDSGWYSAYHNGQQYILPPISDVSTFFADVSALEETLGYQYSYFYYSYRHFFTLQDTSEFFNAIGTSTVNIPICKVYNPSNPYYYNFYDSNAPEECDYGYTYMYLSRCNNQLRFYYDRGDHDYQFILYAFNPYNIKATVEPELVHRVQLSGSSASSTVDTYLPYLQFKCDFEMNDTLTYTVNWYINGVIRKSAGPSSVPQELIFGEDDFEPSTTLGFEIYCGVIVHSDSVGTSNESISPSFFAGIQVTNPTIQVTKTGTAVVEAKITVPVGCVYTSDDTVGYNEQLILFDPSRTRTVCGGGLQITNYDGNGCSENIQCIRQGETWDPEKVYRFMVSTIEDTYDDKKEYNLTMKVKKDVGHAIWGSYAVDGIEVEVTNTSSTDTSYKNKACYSHVDPHMKTCDGIYYEQQRPANSLFYRHRLLNIQVQEFTKYCFDDGRAPVCACGIAVVVGTDVFLLHRCGSITYNDFPHCGDGGLIDVEMVNGFLYKITLPTGTKIVVNLHDGYYMNTMNIDLLVSPKDIGQIEGLGGNFDGDMGNDFVRSDGVVSNNNYDYSFSESWSVSSEDNVVENLDDLNFPSWSAQNRINCWCDAETEECEELVGQSCSRATSLTQHKCSFNNRRKRDTSGKLPREELRRLKKLMLTPPPVKSSLHKRSADGPVDNETATAICTEQMNNSVAFNEFSDKLAGESMDEVIRQCIFDVMAGNDTSLANVHTQALNVMAQTMLEMTPEFVEANEDTVKSFLKQTCLNNCTAPNGMCLDNGQCECSGTMKGPDCSIDSSKPPEILDFQGGGVCDVTNGDDCLCFVVRFDYIFEGFRIHMTILRLYFDGTLEVEEETDIEGLYEDLFTGLVCIPESRKKRSVSGTGNQDFILSYNVSISNDGSSFGDPQTIYIYESLCQVLNVTGSSATVTLKDGFCFISGICVSNMTTDGCKVCIPSENSFGWSYDNCDNTAGDDKDKELLTQAAIVGIIAGSTCAFLMVTALAIYKVYQSTMKKNRVSDSSQWSTEMTSPVHNIHFNPSKMHAVNMYKN